MSHLGDDMTSMETSITDLQAGLNVASRPVKNHFKPGWLITALIVVILIGVGMYLLTMRFVRVDSNTTAIKKSCEIRNEQIVVVNAKFAQLVALFNVSLEHRNPGEPPPSAEILKLYDDFRKPIKLLDCRDE